MMGIRQKIVNKELVFGTWLQTGNPVVAEIMAEYGWDYIAADMEHTAINENDFVDFARAVKGRTAAFARVESDDALAIRKVLDFRPAAIISRLDLRRPIYRQTAAYGHFGRPELDLPWEKLDRVEALKATL